MALGKAQEWPGRMPSVPVPRVAPVDLGRTPVDVSPHLSAAFDPSRAVAVQRSAPLVTAAGGARSQADKVVRRSLQRFLISVVAIVAVLAAAAFVVSDALATRETLRDAELLTRNVAIGLVAPYVAADPDRRSERDLSQLDLLMRSRREDETILRIKVWDRSGTIVYSDEPRLIGRRFPLERDVRQLFDTQGFTAELSRLGDEENILEQHLTSVVNDVIVVYVGFHGNDGGALVFEAYLPGDGLARERALHLRGLVGFSLAAIVLVLLFTLPLSLSLARRVQTAQKGRTKLLEAALASSERERRKIARELHDTVIADLAGLGYATRAAVAKLDSSPEAARRDLVEGLRLLDGSQDRLRAMLSDLIPPSYERLGLEAAVQECVAPLRVAGIEVRMELSGARLLDGVSCRVAYNVISEALRNVLRHASANKVAVEIIGRGDAVEVSVTDDGVGASDLRVAHPRSATETSLAASDAIGPDRRKHHGIRLLTDAVAEVGGSLNVVSRAGEGTRVSAIVPAQGGIR